MPNFQIGERWIGDAHPTYFIADIAANHDGSLERAKRLVRLAGEAGADAAKFQHFSAPKIVSAYGFGAMRGKLSHQAGWEKSVYEVYEDASVPWEWTEELKACCDAAGVDFFSSPYDFGAVDFLAPYVDVYKIGSGDITWHEMLRKIAGKGKPVILATGSSDLGEVQRAVRCILQSNGKLALLQCNTNYTGAEENFRHIHLNVLRTFRMLYPSVVVGLSDHTPAHATVLGAIALGGRVVEKHFTDDVGRKGPDHAFSMTPAAWREMVDRARELEAALGGAEKAVVENERDTAVVQRRCLRAASDLEAGTIIARAHIEVLRPAPADSIAPYDLEKIIGKRVSRAMRAGQEFTWDAVGGAVA